MLWFFLDTLAIVKRFHKEKGTDAVDGIITSIVEGNHKGILSLLTVLEFVSVFRKKVNSREITWKDFIDTVAGFVEESTENFSFQAAESVMYTEAMDYVVKYSLFAPDSLNLAVMNRVAQTIEKAKLVLVSADRKLCESAEQEGFRTLDPEIVTGKGVEEILKL